MMGAGRRPVAWALLFIAVIALAAHGRPPHGVAADATTLATTETVLGAWNGHWAGEGSPGRGSAELVLARVPGRDSVVGQFTFVSGGAVRSLRYEGHIEDGALRFPLVGDGRIVLEPRAAPRPGTAQRLRGEWTDDRGALPAPRGTIELSRVE